MKFFLVVMWITITGEQIVLDGWHPIVIDNEERCQVAKQNLEEYVDRTKLINQLDNIVDVSVECIIIK